MKPLLLPLLLVLATAARADDDPQAGQARAALCMACHGADGYSSIPQFPHLAGQGASYLLKQLQEIRTSNGGADAGRPVPAMQGLLEPLDSQALAGLADWFARQPLRPVPDRAADPAGARLYLQGDLERHIPACSACHGPQATGNDPARFPRLAGQPAAYTLKQLQDFRSGLRHNDLPGRMMQDIASRLTPADMETLARYLESLP